MRLLLIFFCAISLFAAPISHFKQKLSKAKNGDYIVLDANKMITVLAIRSNTPKSLVIEEISAPLHNLKKRPASWPEWIREKAPGHTSWSMTEIDPQTGQVLECYSFSRATWIQTSSRDNLFATLLTLPLEELPEKWRRKIGSPPQPGEPDHRQVWKPPVVFEGKKREKSSFDVFQTQWPNDQTELSGKTISLYFNREISFPFPFWIQVESSHVTGVLQVIDAGKHLPSHYRTIPHRIPEFLGQPQKTKTGLKFSLKSPKYYRSFELFAIDVTHREKQIFPITHFLSEGEGELLTIEINEEHLKQVLEPEHRYTWLLVPQGHTESYTETTKPFVWTDKN